MTRVLFLAPLTAALVACSTAPSTRVSVPLPVECRVQAPPRPVMPTDALRSGVDVDHWVQAAQAELLLREGYESELEAALAACTAPLGR
ncbi:hypothetical protein [Pseudacidovorax sp. RU35E]|uniref:hypothetical protein n=1 Tax=Pseudacidovorax sp. RU35E TaxID=1907403 RepID=UPI000956FAE3|nr:hypothetical protein [Pseudacidovorax sp. RU35E]SIQ99422.1 hypothetical protein SAMN05880557_10764 [Pseudacidovorax sp. RU35E]